MNKDLLTYTAASARIMGQGPRRDGRRVRGRSRGRGNESTFEISQLSHWEFPTFQQYYKHLEEYGSAKKYTYETQVSFQNKLNRHLGKR